MSDIKTSTNSGMIASYEYVYSNPVNQAKSELELED